MSQSAPHLVEDLLEEIFLRLPTPAALARASTACPRFRRIITHGSFLRRYRKLHPPPLLGFVGESGFHPAEAPHPSAPLARALADAADFTYSFVPEPREGHWKPIDIRDGRVLLLGSRSGYMFSLAVCDPLSRRYVLIPPMPEDLAVPEEKLLQIKSMLAPIGEDDDEMSFKVIYLAFHRSQLVAFVFSSMTGHCHLHGYVYWTGLWSERDKLLVLDTRGMEFSTVNFRTGYHTQLLNRPHQPRRSP
uniref:Uncharacterized protein n=2 Tax=Avena sativa TaxID=4498 RepID=A0ACD5XPH2_AVESA